MSFGYCTSLCGEISVTELAELAAMEFEAYEINDDALAILFDWACEASWEVDKTAVTILYDSHRE